MVYEEDRLQVAALPQRRAAAVSSTPLVLVFALVNRPYILDILPDKSVVGHFVNAGFDTYLIDWGRPTHADRHSRWTTTSTATCSTWSISSARADRQPQANVLGYCMGGTMSAMFTALHPEW